jgi:hypothetical protein
MTQKHPSPSPTPTSNVYRTAPEAPLFSLVTTFKQNFCWWFFADFCDILQEILGEGGGKIWLPHEAGGQAQVLAQEIFPPQEWKSLLLEVTGDRMTTK